MSAPAQERPHLLRIGDLARTTGKSARAIHLYEELGLLQPATRSSGGFRLYDPGAVERMRWIDLLHGLGFSLQEMRGVLRNWWSSEQGPAAMEELRSLFQRKLEETRESIRRHLTRRTRCWSCSSSAAPRATGCGSECGAAAARATPTSWSSARPRRRATRCTRATASSWSSTPRA